ncbi:efflux RND transporter periplasmic adaptor subunit [Dongia rigui]|uniref:Efflux RND transporter periplasmic adaptor subunit n=1 Tax=Dongia rigui TaxID=940149 RepID=A0ABU5E410_9PROT|nr:efflux RND transporter periplasmic adaptor subunit [Dongia rigui]MDY0873556.1 efflux RND transporter periplasmic adaptor subunit [Dongia rigui]
MTIAPDSRTHRQAAATPLRADPTPALGHKRKPAAKRRRPARWPWFLGVLLLAVGGGGAAWQLTRSEASTASQYVLADVEIGNIEDTVSAVGEIQPRDYVDVGAQVSGQIIALNVAVGDRVEKGALLAELDASVLKSQVAANQAQLLNLRAQLEEKTAQLQLTNEQYKREAGLMAQDATSQDALDTAAANLRSAKAQIASIKAQIQQTQSELEGDEANLGYTRIYAPMSGTVVTLDARLGQTLNANQSAPILMRIADLNTMTVEAQVSEADISRLALGMTATFTTLGQSERRWSGELRQILPTPEEVNGVILYDALFDVANPDGKLMTQMSAQVTFMVAEAKNVVTVPSAALRPATDKSAPTGSYQVLLAQADGSFTPRNIVIGVKNRNVAEVTEGLQAGDQVVVGERSANALAGGNNRGGFRGFP